MFPSLDQLRGSPYMIAAITAKPVVGFHFDHDPTSFHRHLLIDRKLRERYLQNAWCATLNDVFMAPSSMRMSSIQWETIELV